MEAGYPSWLMKQLGGLLGECQLLRKLIEKSPPGFRQILQGVDAGLRGISQVVFANNPISGLLMLIGLFMADVFIGLVAIYTSAVAVLVAAYSGQDKTLVQNGLTQFNAVLVGTVLISLWPAITGGSLTLRVWLLAVAGAAATVILDRAVAGFLTGVRASHFTRPGGARTEIGVPGFTFPFNLVGWAVWSVLLRTESLEEVESATAEVISNEEDIVWTQLLLGSVYGMGQVFGVLSLPCSILCYIGVAIFSPAIAIAQFLGSLLACFVALGVGVSSYSEVYIGVWSYSALLTAGAMVFFTQPSLRSLPLHLFAVFITVVLHSALSPILATFNLPIFTLPFVLTSWLFLLFPTGNDTIIRTLETLTPEQRMFRARKSPDEKVTDEATIAKENQLAVVEQGEA